ncbi:hypothetical protein BJ170DRAFT_36193 [Xylariales sp. AK1849]|nr:hypothetical protein BJ170DRAFT_36193 [Xylariales sp. AK1849]
MSAAYGSGGSRRSGPNLSQYLQDLNEISSPHESPPKNDNPLNDDDLAMFTNTQFIEWGEQGRSQGQGQVDFSASVKDKERPATTAVSGDTAVSSSAVGDFDFGISDEFNSFDFGTFAAPSVSNFPDSLGNLQPLSNNPPSTYAQAGAQQSPYAVPPQAGQKRASDAGHSRQLNFEDQSRFAAEEDKRRRNTAASARFRVKKKAREQALERREKELNDEVAQLKNRITHLETENKWLRGLVMEKTGSKESKFDPKLKAALKVLGKDSDSEEDDKRKSVESEKKAEKAR